MKKGLILGIVVLTTVVVALALLIVNFANNGGTESAETSIEANNTKESGSSRFESDVAPANLSMPFNINDLDFSNGVLNPLGIVRFDADQKDIGHSGIDFPLKQGSMIYAVSDGKIILIESAEDDWGGMKAVQLLKQTASGDGWAFTYEHIDVAEEVFEGTELKRGDLIGTKIAPDQFTAHFHISRVFNDFQFTSDFQCWPDLLTSNDKNMLDSWWEDYRNSETLINAWDTIQNEGKYPFKGLLDKSKYPNGPQLCYTLGTDVR